MEALRYEMFDSPIGALLIAADSTALREIRFPNGREGLAPPDEGIRGGALCDQAAEQLTEYFSGGRWDFDLPLAPRGTAFRKSVWLELLRIPYGETISYGELARRIGRPAAARAVGAANGSNPLPIVVPCHRVIGRDGTLTGYGGGLPIKRKLLELEGATVLG